MYWNALKEPNQPKRDEVRRDSYPACSQHSSTVKISKAQLIGSFFLECRCFFFLSFLPLPVPWGWRRIRSASAAVNGWWTETLSKLHAENQEDYSDQLLFFPTRKAFKKIKKCVNTYRDCTHRVCSERLPARRQTSCFVKWPYLSQKETHRDWGGYKWEPIFFPFIFWSRG